MTQETKNMKRVLLGFITIFLVLITFKSAMALHLPNATNITFYYEWNNTDEGTFSPMIGISESSGVGSDYIVDNVGIANDAINLTNGQWYTFDNDMTVPYNFTHEMVIQCNTTNPSPLRYITHLEKSDGNNHIVVYLSTAGNLVAQIRGGGATPTQNIQLTDLSNGTWHYIAWGRSILRNDFFLYVDGNLRLNDTLNTGPNESLTLNSGNNFLHSAPGGSNQLEYCDISMQRLSLRELSASEIESNNATIWSESITNFSFSENTTARIRDFTNVEVWENTLNISIDPTVWEYDLMSIEFNNDTSGNYQQVIYFENDGSSQSFDLYIDQPDISLEIAVQAGGQSLEDIRVCSYYPVNSTQDWVLTNCEYTNNIGRVYLSLNDENVYQICASGDDIQDTCITKYIPPADTEITVIQTELTDPGGTIVSYLTDCSTVMTEIKNCTLNMSTYNDLATVLVSSKKNTTSSTAPIEAWANTTYTNIQSFTHNFELAINNTDYEINITIDGILDRIFRYHYEVYNPTVNITFNQTTHSDGDTIVEKLESDREYLVLFYVIMLLFGLLAMWATNKIFEGYGIYGYGVWCAIIASGGFQLLWIPAAIIFSYILLKNILPLIKGG